MSADLIAASICHRQGVDLEKNHKRTLEWIDSLVEKDLVMMFDSPSLPHKADAFWEVEDDDVEGMKEICRDAVNSLINVCLSLDDIDQREWLGWVFYWTGGMSWGDSPSEAYDIMCRFDQMGMIGSALFAMLGFEWPSKDAEPFKIEEEPSIHD